MKYTSILLFAQEATSDMRLLRLLMSICARCDSCARDATYELGHAFSSITHQYTYFQLKEALRIQAPEEQMSLFMKRRLAIVN